ncbi:MULTISPECIES: hypothetical protein [unclassified Salinivibrio]|uniref:hypothetical protein n=1 Tax=unclassified Salinivibrio TaxID=2636825 RepID=UPI001300CE4D|nr:MULTISPECIES: hypothetical protein [unclassified Salinivibrio]
MSMNLAAKANAAMRSGKKLSSYDLPTEVKRKIAARRYSQEEINSKYAEYRAAKAAG